MSSVLPLVHAFKVHSSLKSCDLSHLNQQDIQQVVSLALWLHVFLILSPDGRRSPATWREREGSVATQDNSDGLTHHSDWHSDRQSDHSDLAGFAGVKPAGSDSDSFGSPLLINRAAMHLVV